MPELAQTERLLPSLLDRLTDHERATPVESRAQRALSVRQLRENVIRDLLWLLNTTRYDAGSSELAAYPEVARSVVNYGIPDLAGVTASSVDAEALGRAIREAVATFEPRLQRRSLQVRATLADDRMAHNTLVIEVEGEVWADPAPLRLLLRTELDLETGTVGLVKSVG